MKSLKVLIIIVAMITLLLGISITNAHAQWWLNAGTFGVTSIGPSWFQTGVGVPTWLTTGIGGPFWASTIAPLLPPTTAFPTTTPVTGGVTPLMIAPTPTGIGGIALWPTVVMFGGTPTVTPFAPITAPTIPTTGFVPPTLFGGGAAITPLMVAPTTTPVGGIAFWPTVTMLPTAPTVPTIPPTFPAFPAPAFGIPAITPLMVAPTTTPVGGVALWPTVAMLATAPVAPTAGGAIWPTAVVMPPII